jgi:outer membrane protein
VTEEAFLAKEMTLFMPQWSGILVLFVVVVGSSGSASAQSANPLPSFNWPPLPSVSGPWTVTVGASGQLVPDFEGADHEKLSAVPIFYIHRTGTSDEAFHSPRDGASFALIDYEGFRAGPVGAYKAARTASSSSALNGLGDVKGAVEVGGFAEYFPVDWFRTRVEVRQGFGGNHGVEADASADVIVPISPRFTWSGGPRLTLEDTEATSPYFGISAVQAADSGLPAYGAHGGVHSAGAGTQLRYQIDPKWEVHSYVEYDRLLGSAADSPLVTLRGSPNQVNVGLGASYSFDVRVP